MDEVRRVLHVSGGTLVNRGVERTLMNYYKYINREKIQFDFLTAQSCLNDEMRQEISHLGGRIFELNCGGGGYRRLYFYIKLYRFLKSHNYHVVSVATGSIATMTSVSYIARKTGVETRIVHSQNTGIRSIKYRIIKALCSPFLVFAPTHYLACSKAAGQYTFPKVVQDKVKVVPNAIPSEAFRFNEEIRKKIRYKLGIESKFVIGHIGAFVPQKNHRFLIQIFSKVSNKCENCTLLLIGTGETQNEIRRYVQELGLVDSVIFYGNSDRSFDLYQAMDCFVFPSCFEGLGIVTIEAQAAGLKTLCSDAVPKETRVTELVDYMSLNESAEKWASKVLSYKENYVREDMIAEIIRAGYDIKDCISCLEDVYYGNSQKKTRNI